MKTKPKHRNYKLHPSTMVKFWKSGIISRFLAVLWKNEWKRTIMNSWMFIRNELIQEVDFVTISVYWFHICRVEDFNFLASTVNYFFYPTNFIIAINQKTIGKKVQFVKEVWTFLFFKKPSLEDSIFFHLFPKYSSTSINFYIAWQVFVFSSVQRLAKIFGFLNFFLIRRLEFKQKHNIWSL